ncbi:hypothetical protein [Wohlfahrtiimonas chitiniclastica]|uniref:hypothetical protein n=1 Tax=Wohlfahrtiimonas chitiniclastica TaxID=400946 RepID=UPI0011D041B3|nr:hypothetical protein [Wohlfahrtiimonas chitiniclastica]MDC7252385.1 hypothetical protein [Wohlfahrtiimonas chitiniclastica]
MKNTVSTDSIHSLIKLYKRLNTRWEEDIEKAKLHEQKVYYKASINTYNSVIEDLESLLQD